MNNDLKKLIFAHRGIFNNLNVPENSLKAFKKALINNYNIELDMQLTKDEKLIVFHDYNLFRMTGKNKLVKKCLYDEIKKLHLLNTKEKIPLLEDVLKMIKGKVIINIEIKNKDRKNKTLSILNELLSKYNGKIIIQSFYKNYLTILNKKYSNYVKGLLINLPNYYKYKLKFFIKLNSIDFIAYNKSLIKNKKVQKLRRIIPIFAWTIKTKEEEIEAFKYADSIISNIRK